MSERALAASVPPTSLKDIVDLPLSHEVESLLLLIRVVLVGNSKAREVISANNSRQHLFDIVWSDNQRPSTKENSAQNARREQKVWSRRRSCWSRRFFFWKGRCRESFIVRVRFSFPSFWFQISMRFSYIYMKKEIFCAHFLLCPYILPCLHLVQHEYLEKSCVFATRTLRRVHKNFKTSTNMAGELDHYSWGIYSTGSISEITG